MPIRILLCIYATLLNLSTSASFRFTVFRLHIKIITFQLSFPFQSQTHTISVCCKQNTSTCLPNDYISSQKRSLALLSFLKSTFIAQNISVSGMKWEQLFAFESLQIEWSSREAESGAPVKQRVEFS